MRIERTGIRYFSFEELAKEAFGIKTVKKDSKKMKALQESFVTNYYCKACDKPMSYQGGSVMVCNNPDCKGIKCNKTNKDGSESTFYITSYFLLDRKHQKQAERLFR